MGGRAVVLVDPGREVGQAVGRQQEVQPPRHAQLLPGLGGLLGPARAQPDLGEGVLGVGVDDVEHLLGTEAGDKLLGATGADVLDPAQVPGEGGGVLGRQRPRL